MLSNISRLFGGRNEDLPDPKPDPPSIQTSNIVPVVAIEAETQRPVGNSNAETHNDGLTPRSRSRISLATIAVAPTYRTEHGSNLEGPHTRYPYQMTSSTPPAPLHLAAPLHSTLYICSDLDTPTHNRAGASSGDPRTAFSKLFGGSDTSGSRSITSVGSHTSSYARPKPSTLAPPPAVTQQSAQVAPFGENLIHRHNPQSGPVVNQINRAQPQYPASSVPLVAPGSENNFSAPYAPRSDLTGKTPETPKQKPVDCPKYENLPEGTMFALYSPTLNGQQELNSLPPPSYDGPELVQTNTSIPSGEMSSENMFECLVARGCPDLTLDMNLERYSKRMVAAGSVGDIYRGELRDGTSVAIKMWRIFEYPTKSIKRASREIYNWSKMDHNNVQQLLGVVMLDGRIGMVSEWMANSDLQAYVRKNQDTNRYGLCIQVVKGVQYLHNSGIVHGDLKAVNILVSGQGVPRLTDFDHSIMLDGTLMFSETTQIGGGTARWMAPELHADEAPRRNKKTDIYALGMTMLEIITGTVPYPECINETQVIRKVDKQILPTQTEHFTRDERGRRVWDLLTECWDHSPNTRPTADSVLQTLTLLNGETPPV